MPAPRKSQKPAAETPVQPEPGESAGAQAEAEPAAAEVEPAPMNRAERRAKGKRAGQVQPAGHGKVARSTGPAPGPRMWSNRRSG